MYRHVIGSLAGPGQFLDNCRVFATPNNGRTPRGGCGDGPPDSHSEPRVRGVRLEPSCSVRGPLGQIGKGGGSMVTLARASPFQGHPEADGARVGGEGRSGAGGVVGAGGHLGGEPDHDLLLNRASSTVPGGSSLTT